MNTNFKKRKKVMELIDPVTSMFQCRVCGELHKGMIATGGRFKRGTWQCQYGCTLSAAISKQKLINN